MMTTLLVLCALGAPEAAPAVFHAANAELRAYLLEAGEHNPALQRRHAQWAAALERIPQAKSLDDPMFSYGQFLQSDVNRLKWSLAQKFPWFGTLRTRGDKAAAQAEAALARLYSMRNRVFADVKQAYFEYAFLGESVRVTAAQIEILGYTEETVRSKYSLGLAKENELLRVQIAQVTVQDRLDGLKQIRPALSARLGEALGRARPEVLPWPQAAPLPLPAPATGDILARIEQANPDLAALDHLLASRAEQVTLARKMGFPSFTVGIDYTSVSRPRKIRPDRPYPSSLQGARRLLTGTSMGPAGALFDLYSVANSDEPMAYRSGGRDNIMLSFKVNVPIWRKRVKAGVEEAKHLEKATEREKQRTLLGLESAAQMTVFGLGDARRRYDLYEESLLPKAQQTYLSLQSAYATGDASADFLDLLDSVRLLLDFELEQIRAGRDLQLAAAELEFLMGGPWITAPAEVD